MKKTATIRVQGDPRDPETGADIEMEVWKDPESGGMVGIDHSFLDQMGDNIPSPFTMSATLHLPREAEDEVHCKFCRKLVYPHLAHRHDGGWVCRECWDERLKATE